MTLKEAIKERLQKHYPGTHPDDFFTKWGAQPFNNDTDTDCYIIINDDQTIIVALSTKTHPEDSAQEVRNGVTITYLSWNDYACTPDENPIIHYDTEKTVTDIEQIVPTIKALYKKINKLRFDR